MLFVHRLSLFVAGGRSVSAQVPAGAVSFPLGPKQSSRFGTSSRWKVILQRGISLVHLSKLPLDASHHACSAFQMSQQRYNLHTCRGVHPPKTMKHPPYFRKLFRQSRKTSQVTLLHLSPFFFHKYVHFPPKTSPNLSCTKISFFP